ncbi:MAG: hypothetical protein D6722_20055 [Bacteroidetes bacterium]|nr:MAG: hypothetical protein D6722_20055 [Bacteroidota bacterium]
MLRSVFYFALILPALLPAQDLILTAEEEEIIAEVIALDETHLYYRLLNPARPDTLSIPKAGLQQVYYADGLRQYFSVAASRAGEPERVRTTADHIALYEQGVSDARTHYDNKAVMWGTLGASISAPATGIPLGLVTGATLVLVPPRPKLETLPDPDLYMSQEAYAMGYHDQIRRRKGQRALMGLGMGIGLQAAFFGALIALLSL